MTASVLLAPPRQARARAPSGKDDRRLDQVIDGLWETLMRDRLAECPVCGGEMRPEYGVGARPVAGRCGACRSRLT